MTTAAGAMRVLLVDDEPLARGGVRALCEATPGVSVVGECGDGAAAIDAIRALRPDVVLLDVQMPGVDGFGVLQALAPAELPVIIFVTAFDRFALRAFEVNALDYLLKPFDDERFAAALARARRTLHAHGAAAVAERVRALLGELGEAAAPRDEAGASHRTGYGTGYHAGYLTRLVVRERERTLLVRSEEIDWIEAEDYYAALHVGPRRHLVRETMASLEERLDPARFFRTHRSAIVNLDRVRELQPWFRGQSVVRLQGGATVPLSRSRRERLEARLGQRL